MKVTPKYYTAFIADLKPEVHVTHKYLGSQDDEAMGLIKKDIEEFLSTFPLPQLAFYVKFDKRDYLGPHHDVPVLRPSEPWDDPAYMLALREKLNYWNRDSYPDYKPHVTTSYVALLMPFAYYALMCKDKIIQAWPLTAPLSKP